jgi:hypothetical protein
MVVMSRSMSGVIGFAGWMLCARTRALIRKLFLIAALSLLSWLSTFTGMLDIIAANRGELSGRDIAVVGVAVAVLQLMTLYILDALFAGKLKGWLKPLYVAGYALLALISMTFSFGFYWNLLEARSQSAAAAMDSIAEVQRALEAGRSRLQQLEQTFLTLAALSRQKGEQERERGGSCGARGGGPGPLQLREADSQRLSYAAQLISQRAQSVQAEIADVDAEFAKLASMTRAGGGSARSPGRGGAPDWNSAIRGFDRSLGVTASRYNALRSDPQLLSIKDELARRAEQTVFAAPSRRRFVCRDPQLASALRGAARAISELPEVPVQRLIGMEGDQAAYEAFRRLQTSIRGWWGGGSHGAPGEMGLASRDFLPLGIAVFVDFCIFLIVMNRPWGMFHNLLAGGEDSETCELDMFLRLFHQSFVNTHGIEPKTFDLVRPLHDAVFSYNGSYFGVAPLSLPEQRGESNRLHREARYVANVLVALEGRGLVRLVPPFKRWTGLLTEKRIAKKLSLQGSPYACAGAFRLYRFAPQAWQGIVLRSVLGASVSENAGSAEARDAEMSPEGAVPRRTPRTMRGEVRRREAVSVSQALQCIRDDEGVEKNNSAKIELLPPRRKLVAPPPPEKETGRTPPETAETVVDDLVYDQSESQDVDYEREHAPGLNPIHRPRKSIQR